MPRPFLQPAPLALSLALAFGAASGLPSIAHAQTANPAVLQLHLAAQPLGQALNELARQSHLELMVQPALVAGKTAPALQGAFTLQQAIDRLLTGTGLVAVRDANMLVIKSAPAGTATLSEVLVTASNRETPWGPVYGYAARRAMSASKDDAALNETPQSISVVTRDQMDDQGAQTVTDALRYVAGVNTSAYGEDPRYDWITVRGFNQSVFGMYRDGLRASGSKIGMRIDPYGLERIEVLKGPTSVLYGQNAPGGLINSVTKRPTSEPVHEVSLGLGSHERKQMQFDLGGPVAGSDTLSYRLTGNVRESNTQMQYAPDDHVYIAPAITWKPDASTSLTVLMNYQKDRTAWGLWYPRAGTLNPSPWGQIKPGFYPGEPNFNQFKREQYSVSSLFERKFDSGVVFRQSLRAEHIDYDAAYVRGRGLINTKGQVDDNGYLLFRDANRGRLNSDVYAVDNQLAWNWQAGGVEHHLLAGLDSSLTRYTDRQLSGSAPVLDIRNPQYGQPIKEPTDPWSRDVTARQTGVYLQDRIELGERWVVRGGIRHDWARTDTIDPLGTLALRQRNGATTLQAGALYKAGNGWTPFANYAESFQPTAQASKSGAPFEPTKGKSVEAGVRYQPDDSRSMFTASVYNIRQSNVLTQDPTDSRYSVQTGEVRSRGLELEGVWEATRQLTVMASYTYMDARVTRSNILGEVGTRPRDSWGTTSPSQMASIWAYYRFGDGALRGVTIGGGARYMGSTTDYGASPSAPDNAYSFQAKTPAYTVYDLALGYEPDAHWRFQLKINNLFNKLYVANPCGGSPLSACYYGPVRSVLLSGTYRW